ncbi:hypothetical protein QUB27_21860 [Microcoleus sp. AT8-B6]|uniref:hypothetical protein n=1 Tax=unclassified Microcoleus TaxID=2642155 RepID=UPI002FD1C4BC
MNLRFWITSKIPELTNYSVKQKLDRIQPQHELVCQLFFISPGHLPGSLDTGFGWSKIHVVDKLIRDRG